MRFCLENFYSEEKARDFLFPFSHSERECTERTRENQPAQLNELHKFALIFSLFFTLAAPLKGEFKYAFE